MWHAAYKRKGTLRMHSCLLEFGCAHSREEVLAKVRARLESDPFFKRRHLGGHFVAVDLEGMIQAGDAEYFS